MKWAIKKIEATPNAKIRLALTIILVGLAVGFATRREFYFEALVDPFFGFALASLVILHLRISHRLSDFLSVALCTIALAAVDFYILRYPARIAAWLSFLGVGSLLILGVRAIWAQRIGRKLLLYAWIPAVLFVVSEWFASNMLAWVTAAHPTTPDLYLMSFDASLHVQLSFVMGRAFALWTWLRVPGLLFYIGLAVPISLVYAGRLVRFGPKAFSVMLAFLITGPLGILFYYIFPACGPANTAHQFFPFHPLSIDQMSRMVLEPIASTGVENAMPSLHMAWTLLAWWYSRGLSKWERSIAFAFVGFTVLATLGTGEHYFIDLIVAFPFALMIQSLCAYQLPWRNSARVAAFLFGAGTTFAWLAGLRYANHLFWVSPVIPWSLVIATVAVTEIRRAKFQKTADLVRMKPTTAPGPAVRTAEALG